MASTSSTVRLIFQGSQQGVVSAAAQSIAALKALGDENTKVGKAFGKADEQATKFIKTATKAAAVTSLVTAVGGGLGQAFAGALPILASLGIAAGTVALGMDGIKKAAEVTKKPFEDLKKAVSGTFARDMAAPFKDVAGLLPKLTSGFQGVATSISGAFGSITKFAASARGVAVLQDVLAGAASFIDGFGPQLTKFLDGFLSAIASAKGEMRGLGDAFGSIFGKIGEVLRTLANDDMGTFSKAISAGVCVAPRARYRHRHGR
jgi:phage-related protein